MNDLIVIDDIQFKIDGPKLEKKLKVHKFGNSYVERFQEFVDEAQQIAKPKSAYKPASFDNEGDDIVVIAGTRLKSRVLSVNLSGIHRVFPFVITGGKEITAWAEDKTDMADRFWAEGILDEVLMSAVASSKESIEQLHGHTKTSVMTPGSIEDWPIEEQKPLFSILGNLEDSIGVTLHESCVMEPRYSVSGIVFPTQIDFQSCMLCPRKTCPKRRAAYDENLYNERYAKKIIKTAE